MSPSMAGWRKMIATAVVAIAFVLIYQVTVVDSRYAARQALLREASAVPSPGARLRFTATAYCKGEITASEQVVVLPQAAEHRAGVADIAVGEDELAARQGADRVDQRDVRGHR